uniref:Uncharacterized protein n=1 Tax=Glossina pallidipes TaxID=7398 RepID=A0A1B0ABX3_GLOPL
MPFYTHPSRSKLDLYNIRRIQDPVSRPKKERKERLNRFLCNFFKKFINNNELLLGKKKEKQNRILKVWNNHQEQATKYGSLLHSENTQQQWITMHE